VCFNARHATPHLEGGSESPIRSIQQEAGEAGAKAETSAIQLRSNILALLSALGDRWAPPRKASLKGIIVSELLWIITPGQLHSRHML